MISEPQQITEDDVERSSTLEQEDIGKWVLIVNGTCQGFWATRQEAVDAKKEIER